MQDRKQVLTQAWNGIRVGTLAVTDGIIGLSLMRQGSRPKPGVRRAWPKGLRESILKDQGGRCVYCGVRLRRALSHIDHVIPVNQGGCNNRPNLQLLCSGCNIRKSDRNDSEFRYRYRSLISTTKGATPARPIAQARFRAVTAAAEDAPTYTRFKAGKYLTPAQKVNTGAIVTGFVTGFGVFLPLNHLIAPDDGSLLLMLGLGAGAAAGGWVKVRAKWTGKDQE